jgi:MFS family permease
MVKPNAGRSSLQVCPYQPSRRAAQARLGGGYRRPGRHTSNLADRIGRKPPIVAGMFIQAVGLAIITAGISRALAAGLGGAFLLGTGTALVYPSLLAAVSDAAHPAWRASALGVYRFWRDAGYAIGALIGGITAVLASLDAAIGVAAVLTAISGILTWALMRETHPRPAADSGSARAAAGKAARRVNGGMT